MDFTNPHFSAPPEETVCTDPAQPAQASRGINDGDTVPDMPRLREVTNSPLQEYAARPGNVTPLPDNVAALICSFKGRAEVQRNGIKVERKELSTQPLFFWHEDSRTCHEMRGQKVIYVINPNTLDCIHIMDTQGRYIETVVRKNQPDILDVKAQAKEIGKHKAYMTRQQNRLQELHGEDTEEILKRHRDNSEAMARATTLHPAEIKEPGKPVTPRETPTADRITDRGQSIQNHITARANQRANASALGHALKDAPIDRSSTTCNQTEAATEDWTDKPASNSRAEESAVHTEEW